MSGRTHYDVLGVAPDASVGTIREAYRRLAREHHPDRAANNAGAGNGSVNGVTGSAAGVRRDMPMINEAYRVLNDPGRRAVYDASLRDTRRIAPADVGSSSPDEPTTWTAPQYRVGADGPARVPWRSLLVVGVFAVFAIVVLAQFTDPAAPRAPDGILRIGDCVEILDNNDAREVACTDSTDLVVGAFVPFDDTCPGMTTAHRDRQGMGVACITSEDG